MNFLERQLDNPVRLARVKRWFVRGLIVVAAAEIVQQLIQQLFSRHHAEFWFELIPAWSSLYGFVSCVTIIVVSKSLGKVWLMRREDYYDA
jgi:hypothetical protein